MTEIFVYIKGSVKTSVVEDTFPHRLVHNCFAQLRMRSAIMNHLRWKGFSKPLPKIADEYLRCYFLCGIITLT